MSVSDIAAIGALVVAGIALWHSFRTERRRNRLEAEHRSLEQKLMQAQLSDRDSTTQARAREIYVRSVNLRLRLQDLQDRMSSGRIGGVALWRDEDVDQLLKLSGQCDNMAARYAAEAADSLHVLTAMVIPYTSGRADGLIIDRRMGAAITDARAALFQLSAHVQPDAGDFTVPEEE